MGRPVRCFGCKQSFVATTERPTPPTGRRAPLPLPPPSARPASDEDDDLNGEGGPFCPGCGRRITWEDLLCRYCGEELEAEDEARAKRRRNLDLVRHDYEPHRAALILSLGNVSMIVGGLSLCSFGAGAVVSVPLGVLTVVMANRDLERMRDGRMDPNAKARTETGRTGAIAGIILGLIFASFYALVYLAG